MIPLISAAAVAAPLPDEVAVPHRTARTGVVLTGVGLGIGAAFPLSAVAVCAATDGDCLSYVFFVGIPVELGAAVLTLTGEGLVFGGSITAASRARDLGLDADPTVGWVGLGLLGAGTAAIVVAAPGTQGYDVPLAIGGIGAAATGTVLGFVQYAKNGAFVDGSVALVPTGNGLALVGRF